MEGQTCASAVAKIAERVREWASGRLAPSSAQRYAVSMDRQWIRDLVGTPRDWAISLSVATAIGAGLALLGPFGTFLNGGLSLRLAYWIGLLWAGVVFYSPSLRVFVRLGGRLDLPVWFGLAAAVLIASLPMAMLARLVAGQVWTRFVSAMSPLDWYGETLILAAPICYALAEFQGLLRPGRAPEMSKPEIAPEREAGPRDDAAPGFLARLSPRLGRDLICLQMEDHYVRAHTALGSELILLPLHEAIAELDGLEGLRVHRSWWVARAAVARVETRGRNFSLILKNNLQAPVSRRAVATLKAAGWTP
jgi:hypothetical protein